MAKMMTAPAQILALAAILGVMPTRKADDSDTFYFRDGDRYFHATLSDGSWLDPKPRFYIGASDKGIDAYTTGQLPLGADLSSLTMADPFGTLSALFQRYPFNERTGDFN